MKVKKFQEGGMAPEQPMAGEQAPMGGEQANAEQQIMQMAAEIVQQLGPEAAAMLAQAIMQILQQPQPVFAKRGTKIQRIS